MPVRFLVEFKAARQRELLARIGLDPQDWRQIGAALAIGIVLAVSISFLLLWRGSPTRSRDPLLAAWQHFTARLARAGLGKHDSETAGAFIERAAAHWPQQAEALRALTRRYSAQRYAALTPDDGQHRELIRELRHFRPVSPAARRTP